ncbi:MAG: S-methyl-5-thioribose-1-phosphate isomerase [Burkholderiaceae bacterium]|jgi:methylthioribose-1-phosphate isomerase|nr:S-methyl-5-thioribose-1-phosphate isomerase [Burkholderiaceae bacterium]
MPPSRSKIETLRLHGHRLDMIDQRVLPAEFRVESCTDAAQVAAAIRNMVVRGAPAIGVAAAYGVALEAVRQQDQSPKEFKSALERAIALLSASRPTAVNLSWALKKMSDKWHAVRHQSPSHIAQVLLDYAQTIHRDDIAINQRLGSHGEKYLNDGARVLTHCNAGALATAGHGTALGVIRSAVQAGKRLSVIADETRPFLQGARLTAWEMVQEGIPVTLITDNMAGHLMAQGEIDAVIVGADRVAANGDVANKIGTYMVAVLAHRHGIPFYVACPLSTIDMSIASGADIPIEERSAEEVTGFRDARWAAQGVSVRHPAFDVTPAALVSGLMTEKGVLLSPDHARLAAFLGQ